jgi:hypothetical protein
MSRRIVPATFCVAILACSLLFVAGALRASGPAVPIAQGGWDGFFLAADSTLGGVQSDITRQDFRRLTGDGVLFDLESGGLYNTINFNATRTAANFITGNGVTQTGRFVFQASLGPFAGLGGNNVMEPEYHFVPPGDDQGRVSALLLHPFAGIDAINIAGSYNGPFVSLADPVTGAPADRTFNGFGTMQISPRNDRGYFTGSVKLFTDTNATPLLSWPFLATTGDDRRVIWIAQGKAGRIIYDGVVVPMSDTDIRLDGVFRIVFNNGRRLFNSYNCSVFSP